jgi:hypothetical protein
VFRQFWSFQPQAPDALLSCVKLATTQLDLMSGWLPPQLP